MTGGSATRPRVALPRRFRIVRELGAGGMGVVYEAEDTERGARIALKTITNLSPVTLARFKREFRVVADLQHPNLVSLGELVSEGNQWFFTMELVDGLDFLEYVRPAQSTADFNPRSVGSVPPPEGSVPPPPGRAGSTPDTTDPRPDPTAFHESRLRSCLLQLASALEALHAGGIVHRDIKPANIRVTAEGRLVLLDFGLAENFARGETMTMAALAGTPAYMAPEQAASSAVGPAADWYAFGVLLHEALTGAYPFVGTPLAMMMEKQTDGPAPSQSTPGVPGDLDALCSRLLRFDQKARPSGAEVVRALGGSASGARAAPSSLTNAAPFVGRAAEVATLRKAFEDSHAGAVTVLVEGESGVGKTSLVRAFLEAMALEVENLVVLSGRCYEREAVPYKAFDGVVDALTRYMMRGVPDAGFFLPTRPEALVQVFPVLRRIEAFAVSPHRLPALDPIEVRSRAFGALREMLVRLGTRRSLVITIDDLQWSDADSLTMLGDVLRAPEAPALLLIGTVRSSALSGETAMTKAGGTMTELGTISSDVRFIGLSPLKHEEARELAEALLRRVVGPDGAGRTLDPDAIAREAEGHPFFIDALVRHASVVKQRIDETAASRVGLQDALTASIRALDPGARRILELLAVAPAPVAQEVLTVAADVEPEAFGRHLARLRVGHLATASGGRAADTAEPYHDRVRSAVLARLDGAARAELHASLARALERLQSNAATSLTQSGLWETLSLHWRGAGDEPRATRYAALAGDAAASALAFDRAAKLYAMALQSGQFTDEVRRSLQEKLGDALASTGRGKESASAYAEAARGALAAHSLELQRHGADQLMRTGHFDEGLAAMQRVLASINIALPASPLTAALLFLAYRLYLRARGLGFRPRDASEVMATELTRVDVCWSLAFGLGMADHMRGAAFQARNLLWALRSGEAYRVARAVALEALYASRAGVPGLRRTEVLLARAQELATTSGNPHALGWVQVASGMGYYLHGQYRRALEHLKKATGMLVEVPGSVWELDSMSFFTMNCLVQLGEIGRVVREVPDALRDARQRGDLYAAVNLRVGLANHAWLAKDDPKTALAQIDAAMAEWSQQGFHLEHYYELLARTNALLYAGRPADAYAAIAARWPPMRRSLLLASIQTLRVHAWHARARTALALAEVDRANRARLLREAGADARRIERERATWAMPWVHLLRAGIAQVKGDRARAVVLLREAVSGFERADLVLYRAAARGRVAELVGGEEGRGLARETEAWMKKESIANPGRMTAMMAPGFGVTG